MPRPRLQRAATARGEKVQLRIREQSFSVIPPSRIMIRDRLGRGRRQSEGDSAGRRAGDIGNLLRGGILMGRGRGLDKGQVMGLRLGTFHGACSRATCDCVCCWNSGAKVDVEATRSPRCHAPRVCCSRGLRHGFGPACLGRRCPVRILLPCGTVCGTASTNFSAGCTLGSKKSVRMLMGRGKLGDGGCATGHVRVRRATGVFSQLLCS